MSNLGEDNNKIKAIVLTFDKYRCFTDHMIQCYENLWPSHKFTFCVPFQEISGTDKTGKVTYVKSKPDIRNTVLTLLDGLDDNEIVYWCIDDKYPIRLDTDRIEEISRRIFHDPMLDASGLLFSRRKKRLSRRILDSPLSIYMQDEILYERKDYSQIWIHQYIKVKALRFLFESLPQGIKSAKSMDALKNNIPKPGNHKLFTTKRIHGMFGESTTRGKITRNCLESMNNHQMPVPNWCIGEATKKDILIGVTILEKIHNGVKRWIHTQWHRADKYPLE
jgi:hypothetical protein